MKYANDNKFKQQKLNSNKQYYERNKDILSKKSNDRIKKNSKTQSIKKSSYKNKKNIILKIDYGIKL